MFRCSKPPKVLIEVVAQVVAAPKQEEADERSEVDGLAAVVLVDDEEVHDAAHGPAHAQRADHERPEHLVEEIPGSGHEEDADG